MKRSEINIRDPFILTHNNKYYMYGTRAKNTWERQPLEKLGFDVYVSDDLENWSEPKQIFSYFDGFWGETQFWAPEVHKYNGKFYMLASFIADGYERGTAIFVCDTPDGTFKEHSNGAVTPKKWGCLDGTLYVENDTPYIVFCHEWTQIQNGTICAMELSKDLKEAVGEPFELWSAGDAPWAYDKRGNGSYVTDGPFLVKKENGELICIWSSFSNGEYVEAISRSSNGSIKGKWSIDNKLLYEKDGGHGMIFTDLNGVGKFVYHSPNETPNERPFYTQIDIESL
ncbi:MAG: family 43 glycosylhydrolase [Clostridia bacterium]|nr:family 43 glycosylhydrolase [Clostridia bacterium]